MRFLKEYLALLFIIIFIIGSDFIFSNMTKKLIQNIDMKIDKISQNIFDEKYDRDEMIKDIDELKNEWKSTEEKMSYFAEHNELEKVSSTIVAIKSNIEMDKKKEAYEKMNDIKFKLEYIKNKQKFELNSLF